MRVNYVLGHDSHGHPITSATGCSGTIQTTVDGEHDANANIFGVLDAEYTPVGSTTPVHVAAGGAAATDPPGRALQRQQGVQVVAKASAHGGNAVGYIENGDWISFTPYNLTGVTVVHGAGRLGRRRRHADRCGPARPPARWSARCTVAPTGGWETWVDVTGTVTPPTGTQTAVPGVHRRRRARCSTSTTFTFTSGGTQPPIGGNLALNKPATASSVESAAYPASAAVDGSATTRWASAFSDPQWIQVDLGQSYAIDRVRLTWEAAYGSAYQIQTSTNGTTWTTVRSVTGGNGGVDDNTGLTAIGPLRAHQRHDPRHRVGLLAVQLRGLRRRRAAAADEQPRAEQAGDGVQRGVGGLPGVGGGGRFATTRWASAFADPQWIQVDLGQSYTINRVRLTWEAAYGSAYQIQTSADGTTWTTVRSVTGGNGGVDDNTGAGRHRAGTCGSTARPAPPPGATRCSSSRSIPVDRAPGTIGSWRICWQPWWSWPWRTRTSMRFSRSD